MIKSTVFIRNACFFVFLFFLSTSVFAQEGFKIKGKISDEKGAPVVGASVLVKGTNNGVMTRTDGTFDVTAPSETATIVVSSVGYTSQEIPLDGKSDLNVTLQSAAASLQDVVVIGYGTRKKVEVTGATSSISGDNLRSVQTSNLTNALRKECLSP